MTDEAANREHRIPTMPPEHDREDVGAPSGLPDVCAVCEDWSTEAAATESQQMVSRATGTTTNG